MNIRVLPVLLFAIAAFLIGGSLGAEDLSLPASVPPLDELAGRWQTISTLRSLPAINSTQGAAKTTGNLLELSHLGLPPVFLDGTVARLSINGTDILADRSRWLPYAVEREGVYEHAIQLMSTVQLSAGGREVVLKLTFTHLLDQERRYRCEIRTDALPIKITQKSWNHPKYKRVAGDAGWTRARSDYRLSIDAGSAAVWEQLSTGTVSAQAFSEKPDEYVVNADPSSTTIDCRASWTDFTLKPGEVRTLYVSYSCGEVREQVLDTARKLVGNGESAVTDARRAWDQLWAALFTPNNGRFSGHLPTLTTPDADIRRVYYGSLVSLLSVYRECFPRQKRVFVTNSPEYNGAMVYYWDTREFATLYALLDPEGLRAFLLDAIRVGTGRGYAIDAISGEPQGPWYSANEYSKLHLALAYLAVTDDRDFLRERVDGKTVLAHLNDFVLFWKTLVRPGRNLADYGEAKNLLECVPTYIHEVPSFNAANVWMMRELASINERLGDPTIAATLRDEAAKLLPHVLALYEPQQGIWNTLHRDGTRFPSRHVFDFATIGLTIPDALTADMRREMVGFVQSDLLTEHWMRAQSHDDPSALNSDRPDHGPMGAFSAWPAEVAAVFCDFGLYREAMDIYRRLAPLLDEGPFSQSRELLGRENNAPARIALRGWQTYNASCGGALAETLLRHLFAFHPRPLADDPWANFADSQDRAFTGELRNIRFRGKNLHLQLGREGLRHTLAKP